MNGCESCDDDKVDAMLLPQTDLELDFGVARELGCGSAVSVNRRLSVAPDESTVSGVLELRACSGGSVDLVVFLLNALTRIEVVLEGSIVPENWSRISSTIFTSEGSARFRFRNQSWRFLRLYYTASGSPGGVGVLAATVNGSRN